MYRWIPKYDNYNKYIHIVHIVAIVQKFNGENFSTINL